MRSHDTQRVSLESPALGLDTSSSAPCGRVLTPSGIARRRAARGELELALSERRRALPTVPEVPIRTASRTADITAHIREAFNSDPQVVEAAARRAAAFDRLAAVEAHTTFKAHYDADGVLRDAGQRSLKLTQFQPVEGVSAPLASDQVLDLDPSIRDSRRRGYALQLVAARLAPSQRVALCHRLSVSKASPVDVRLNGEGRAYLGGVQTCGSVWHCPICAKKITEAKRADLQTMSEAVRAAGGQLVMMTLTVPHRREDDLRKLLSALKAAYRHLVSGKRALPYLLDRWRYIGAVRSLEVTVGSANGWHPHLHVLLALEVPLSESELAALQVTVHARWLAATTRHGFDPIAVGVGVNLQAGMVAGLDRDPITDYLAKWGVSEELSKLHTKAGKRGRTPWQLLAAAEDGDTDAAGLWREYSKVFKGARQLVWSHGFRDRYGLGAERSDDDLASAEPEVHTVLRPLLRAEWVAVRALGSRAELCDMAEYGLVHLNSYIDRCSARWADRMAGATPFDVARLAFKIDDVTSLPQLWSINRRYFRVYGRLTRYIVWNMNIFVQRVSSRARVLPTLSLAPGAWQLVPPPSGVEPRSMDHFKAVMRARRAAVAS